MSQTPSLILYLVVKDSANAEQSRWIPIGAAWPHEDSKGFNISVDMLPLRMPGKHYSFVLRENTRQAASEAS